MSPVFPGEKDIDQLCCVLRVLGTPTEDIWPGMKSLPDYQKIIFPENEPIPFEEIFPDASPEALDLVEKFLVYDSKKRISAAEALLHPYFFTEPLPAHHSELPIPVTHRANKKLRQTSELDVSQPIKNSLIDTALIDMFCWISWKLFVQCIFVFHYRKSRYHVYAKLMLKLCSISS